MKTKIAIIGSGNIGWALKQLLKEDYDIKQGDITDGFDATDISQVKEFLDGVDAVISAGPFAVNKNIAQVASEESIGYFDFTEDVETTDFVKSLKSNNIIMPQCGLAPGAINICAAGMMEEFDTVNEVLMRVGALPRFTTNEMSYYLSWSTNGLINEYCNEADAIYEGRQVIVMPLEGAEKIVIDGESFESLAKEFSEDPGSALQGGDLGWLGLGVLAEEFEATMLEMEIGEISTVFQTEFGFHFLEVLAKRSHELTDDLIKDRAYSILYARKFDEELENTLRSMRAEAFVEFKDLD